MPVSIGKSVVLVAEAAVEKPEEKALPVMEPELDFVLLVDVGELGADTGGGTNDGLCESA